MDQSLPPRPVLFIRLMLILKPSRFRQLFSNLWVTHPHTTTPYDLNGRSISSDTQSVGGDPNAARQASITKHGKRAFLLNSMPVVAAMPERFGVTVETRRLHQLAPFVRRTPVNE